MKCVCSMFSSVWCAIAHLHIFVCFCKMANYNFIDMFKTFLSFCYFAIKTSKMVFTVYWQKATEEKSFKNIKSKNMRLWVHLNFGQNAHVRALCTSVYSWKLKCVVVYACVRCNSLSVFSSSKSSLLLSSPFCLFSSLFNFWNLKISSTSFPLSTKVLKYFKHLWFFFSFSLKEIPCFLKLLSKHSDSTTFFWCSSFSHSHLRNNLIVTNQILPEAPYCF